MGEDKLIKRKNYIFVSVCLSIILLLGGCTSSTLEVPKEKGISDNLDIVIFKIGKADSILLSVGDKTVLIDTGEDDDGDEIVEYMRENNMNTIDYMILTHFDKDHVGGADIILNEVGTLNVITPNYETDSKDYKEFITALEEHELSPRTVTDVFTFAIGSAEFTIDPPEKDTYLKDNDYSLVVSVNHGKNSFLFAGDAEEERLAEMIESNHLEHTVLKVPHHGRYNKLSTAFFTLVHPKYAIITCSDKNPEDEKVMNVLKQLGTEVFLTRNGNIYMTSDGNTLSINQ